MRKVKGIPVPFPDGQRKRMVMIVSVLLILAVFFVSFISLSPLDKRFGSGAAFLAIAAEHESLVNRTFSNFFPFPGEEIIVTLEILNQQNDSILAIDEKMPLTFTVTYPDGGNDSDTSGGVQHIKWVYYNMSGNGLVPNETKNYNVTVPLTDGEYFFTGDYQFEHTAGNQERLIEGYNSIYVDSYPVVALISPTSGSTVDATNNVSLEANATDNFLSSMTFDYSGPVTGSGNSGPLNNATNYTFVYVLLDAPNGDYLWNATACDYTGKCTTSPSWTFTLDYTGNTPPQLTVHGPAPNAVFDDTHVVTFDFTVTDAEDPELNCTIYINDTAQNPNPITVQSGVRNLTDITGIPYGYYSWYITCVDRPQGGLSDTSNTEYFTLRDTIFPTVTLTSPGNVTIENTQTVDFTFTASDPEQTSFVCNMTLDGVVEYTSGYQAPPFIHTMNNVDYGGHSWSASCSDGTNIGLSGTTIFTINDTLEPYVVVDSPADGSIQGRNIPLDYSVADVHTIDSCWYTLNGGSNVNLAGCQNVTDIRQAGYSPGIVTNQTYTLRLYARDSYGNVNLSTVTFDTDFDSPRVNYLNTQTAQLSLAVVNGADVMIEIPLEITNRDLFTVTRINFSRPSWFNMSNFLVSNSSGNYSPDVNGDLSFIFNNVSDYTLIFDVIAPDFTNFNEVSGNNTYTYNFTVRGWNSFKNVSAAITVNDSFPSYMLFWNNGSDWLLSTLLFHFDVVGNTASFYGFNTSLEDFLIEGGCTEDWACSSWSSCDGSQQTRTCTCECTSNGCNGENATSNTCTIYSGNGGNGGGGGGGGGYVPPEEETEEDLLLPEVGTEGYEEEGEAVEGEAETEDEIDVYEDEPEIVDKPIIPWALIGGIIIGLIIIGAGAYFLVRRNEHFKVFKEQYEKGDDKEKLESEIKEERLAQLRDYVDTSRKMGKNDEDIKKALLSVGWKEDVVGEYIKGKV
jgi:hypothetical protein